MIGTGVFCAHMLIGLLELLGYNDRNFWVSVNASQYVLSAPTSIASASIHIDSSNLSAGLS